MKLSRRDSWEEKNRISELPDSLIHHILSFLPRTKDAIRTGILSKRWRNQWCNVPILIFDHIYGGNSYIDQVLNQYGSSKVDTFQIRAPVSKARYHDFDYTFRFAVSREVKELILEFIASAPPDFVQLPECLFSHTLLVKLKISSCTLPKFNEKVNMKHLKELKVHDCECPDGGTNIEIIVCGSPLLESLDIRCCQFNHLVVASKSLCRLVLAELRVPCVGVSCPNLEELCLRHIYDYRNPSDNKIIMSCNTVRFENWGDLVITSKSLRKLVFKEVGASNLAISCPVLEELILWKTSDMRAARVVNLQCLRFASLEFEASLIELIVPQLERVEKLTCGRRFIRALLAADEKSRHDFGGVLNTLKIFQIAGISERDNDLEAVVDFVVFLIKNARVLKKMTMFIQDYRKHADPRVYRKLWRTPRCSQHAIVKLISGGWP